MTADLPSSNKIKVINNIFYYWVIEKKSIFSKVIIAVLQKANFLWSFINVKKRKRARTLIFFNYILIF